MRKLLVALCLAALLVSCFAGAAQSAGTNHADPSAIPDGTRCFTATP